MSDQPLLNGREDSLAHAEQGGPGSVSIAELMARPADKIQELLVDSGVRHLGYVTSKVGGGKPKASATKTSNQALVRMGS